MKRVLKLFGGDKVIWILIVILTVYSVLAVSSSIVSLANSGTKSIAMLIIRHSTFLLVGWGIIYVTHLLPYKYYSIFATVLVFIAVVLLVYTLFESKVNEASRWIRLGNGLSFQTSDFAKLALIIFVARYLSRNQAGIQNLKKGFLPVLLWIVLVCGLIFPANLSTAAILFMACLVLLFIGRVRLLYIGGLFISGIIMAFIVFQIAKVSVEKGRAPTWAQRIESFVNPDEGDTFQAERAKTAIANGGLFGKFAGHSTQKHSLPQAYSDFIFAIIIEEYGFLFGALPILFIYLTLLFRAGMIVRKCDRTFPAFLAIGLTVGMVLQAMINMGVAVGLLPVTGQTLPWISRGGTSILFTAVAFGIILGISRSIEESVEVNVNE